MTPPRKAPSRAPQASHLKGPAEWKGDGVDHINLWVLGTTDLGRCLALNSRIPFTHSVFGEFATLGGFWYYVKSSTKDDRFRYVWGPKLNEVRADSKQERVPNFHAIVLDANWQRIRSHPALAQDLAASTLPFDVYTVNKETGVHNRSPFANWIVEGLEVIRDALRKGIDPDFSRWRDDWNEDLFHAVRPKPKVKSETPPKKRNVLMEKIRQSL